MCVALMMLIRSTEIEARLRKLMNRKAIDKDEVIGEMIKIGDGLVVDWI